MSNLIPEDLVDVVVEDGEVPSFEEVLAALGVPKNEVKLASFLGFFKSDDDAVRGSALRFNEAIEPRKRRENEEGSGILAQAVVQRGGSLVSTTTLNDG